jgi:chaperonin GroEL
LTKEYTPTAAAGVNPMPIERGIDKAVDLVVEELKELAKPAKNKKRYRPGRHHIGKQRPCH